MKLSFGFSIAAVVVGALMIFYALMGHQHLRIEYVGTAMVCTGLVTLTISETFKKP